MTASAALPVIQEVSTTRCSLPPLERRPSYGMTSRLGILPASRLSGPPLYSPEMQLIVSRCWAESESGRLLTVLGIERFLEQCMLYTATDGITRIANAFALREEPDYIPDQPFVKEEVVQVGGLFTVEVALRAPLCSGNPASF